ncbi:MAG: hypothetical protein J5I98_21335 [Phaeodactylibacter sp.]|nr:hypothetical protein [Phaeodactylibacter sp.]
MSNIIIRQPHPLRRNGSTRITRLLAALAPDHFQLDDRSMQDLLVAAHRYAALLSWFDFSDRPDGDWACFWETETLTYLAVLSAIDLNQLRKEYDEADRALGVLLESHEEGESQQETQAYRNLAEILYNMAKGLEGRYRKLVAIRHPLQHLLLGLIRRANERDIEELASPFFRLISLHKAMDDQLNPELYRYFVTDDARWGLADWADYGRIMAEAPADYPREQLRGIFVKFYNAYVVLKNRAQRAFDEELARMEKPESEEYRIVQPHISLFIAFLRLFRHAQDSLNELVGKQLDFYYEQVLALHRAPAQPDSVFLIFTLAKNFDSQFIEQGTQLFGGKDQNGLPILYETVQDWVVSQAKIEAVKSFYLPPNIYALNNPAAEESFENDKTVLGLSHAPPLSQDGVRLFSDDIAAEEQEVGFVIASPQLLLQEGNRLIVINITNVTAALTSELVEVQLSGKEGWTESAITSQSLSAFEVDTSFSSSTLPTTPVFDLNVNASDDLTLKIYLPKDFPPVVPMEGNKMTKWPAVKITLKKSMFFADNGLQDYRNLISTEGGRAFAVSVRAEGVSKNLILQTDQGVFDGTQQVMPFGATAPNGARFYVGFAEAFLKKLDRVVLRPNWVDAFTDSSGLATNYTDYPLDTGEASNTDVAVEFLSNNSFPISHTRTLSFVNDASGTPGDSAALSFDSIEDLPSNPSDFPFDQRDIDPTYSFTKYDPSIRRGFVRLTFKGELFHSEYPEKLTEAATAADPKILPPPYTPTFNSLELDYVSQGQEMDPAVDEFFYLHPFGGYERAELQLSETGAPQYSFGAVTLFKDFIGQDIDQRVRGHLYIGLSQLKPGSNLSLLVQTVEGSEKMPEANAPKIQWSYLSKYNQWKPVNPDKILLDSSRGFTRSGLIQLSIPEDISSKGNTLLPPEWLWLRVTGAEQVDPLRMAAALPGISYLSAQAVEAHFLDTNTNEYSHLADGLPEGTIGKLVFSRSAIKKVEQPFATFGGRLPESEGLAFYMRISERLRHRGRAVTVWDYEHLLLEAFPEIAAVKCIPHTQYFFTIPSEQAPGSVAVAVIPSLDKRVGPARNQPRFPRGDLDEMRDFLLERACLFLGANEPDEPTLYVVNAQYEIVKVDIEVAFRSGVDVAFFKQQLDEDLRRFLSPWLDEGGAPPAFGHTLRRSRLIQFVEELPYIDVVFVQSLEITKDGVVVEDDPIRPGAAHGILCSSRKHEVEAKDIPL